MRVSNKYSIPIITSQKKRKKKEKKEKNKNKEMEVGGSNINICNDFQRKQKSELIVSFNYKVITI